MIVHTEPRSSKIINKLYLVDANEDDTKEELKKTDIKCIKFGPYRCLSKDDIKDQAKRLANLITGEVHSELVTKIILNFTKDESYSIIENQFKF